ncbi:unnamed protein product [Cylicostephanus goldi]|uniref:RGS domain-containing protein n=1 Tax=Cylicostephanus goldi TaxID=71465 RepID=A0A3P7Q7E6_CYLGO|nr:unnamed protein product [Cylicostephanus goldi]
MQLAKNLFQNMSMFDPTAKTDRQPPPMPDTVGVEYPRAASWASGSCAAVLKDEKGCQLFRCFLYEALAEENLSFVEAVDKLKKMKNTDEKKTYAKEIVQLYSPYINLSSGAMKSLKDAVESENVDAEGFAAAVKEVGRHHFRLFLRGIHAEENLRFWEAVVEFRGQKNKSPAQLTAGKTCLNTFLAEGANNEVRKTWECFVKNQNLVEMCLWVNGRLNKC